MIYTGKCSLFICKCLFCDFWVENSVNLFIWSNVFFLIFCLDDLSTDENGEIYPIIAISTFKS